MKRVYIATYKHGIKGPTKVVANSDAAAVRAAYAAYTFTSAMGYPGPDVSDVVESVKPDPEQVTGGYGVQPAVQVSPADIG